MYYMVIIILSKIYKICLQENIKKNKHNLTFLFNINTFINY